MTGTETGFHDKANGAFFPIARGFELRRVQLRLLTALLHQPGLVPMVLATGIRQEDFPEEWHHAFNLVTKEPQRIKQIAADPNCDVTIRKLNAQIVLLGDGQARQLAEQIVISIRGHDLALRSGHENPAESNSEDLDEAPARDGGRNASDDGKAARGREQQDANRFNGFTQGSSAGAAEPQGVVHAADSFAAASDSAAESAGLQDYEQQDGPTQEAPSQSVDADLTKMNEKYAVIRIAGKTRVVWFEESEAYPGCTVPIFSTFYDFRAFHAHPKKILQDRKLKRVGVGQWWLEQKGRTQFNGLTYAPNADVRITSGKLNLWKGFSCEPRPGKCDLFLAHLQDNICCGNKQYYNYLLDWMADATQHPGQQGGVAVVMRGKEGTGKGVAAKQFGQLFGSHYRHIVHAKHLTGHFNAHLQHCSVLFADEAFFAGDRSHEPILKALITEETFLIEPKGIDPFPVRNCVHLIITIG
jgi:Family of unknown function (DUF5906)